MATITEAQFRDFNNLCTPYPFQMVAGFGPVTPSYLTAYNTDQNKPNPLKILPTNDTWHDLAQPRNDYDPTYFNGYVANYLMTGQYVGQLDRVSFYQKAMNYPSFSNGTFPSMRYEAKVAASFENQHGLQRATETIRYGEILLNFDTVTRRITPLLVNKLILSNGSLVIIPGIGRDGTTVLNTFADFINQYDEPDKSTVLLRIAEFIKWYLHSPQYDTLVQDQQFDGVVIPAEIRISADAGFFQLRDIFSPPDSGGIPFITIPNILDSAGTTIEPLDPLRPIQYEATDGTIVYPIVSNYFSSNDIFLCYVINPEKTFGIDGNYCFSLCILNINAGAGLKAAVDAVRTTALNIPQYIDALQRIKMYIDANPGAFPQYFFGEVERGFEGNDDLKCGKCGAGVPYIGKVMAAIQRAYDGLAAGQTILATEAGLVANFNALKNDPTVKLGSRIPIADARILKLLTGWNQASILMLFKLLADYKRTGDYQQIYAVLYAILTAGSNDDCFTFSSGDELAALLSRLCAIPTILQVASIGKTTLYRNTTLAGDAAAQERSQKLKIVKLTEAYILDFDKNFAVILSFIMRNYAQVCELRNQLAALCGVSDGRPTGFLSGNLFYILQVLNAIHKLNTIIKLSNVAFTTDFTTNIMSLLQGYSEITTLTTQGVDISQIPMDNFTQMMRLVGEIKGSQLFTLSGFIKEKLPGLSFDTSESEKVAFAAGDVNLASGNFTIPWLDLVYKLGESKDKKLKALSETYQQRTRAEQRARSSAMKLGEAEKFVMECNSFLQDLTLGELTYYMGVDAELDVVTKAEEAGLQPGSREDVNSALAGAAEIEKQKSAIENYRVEDVTQITASSDTSLQGFIGRVYPLLLQECNATGCVVLTDGVNYLAGFSKKIQNADLPQSKTEEVLRSASASASAQAGSSTREEGQEGGTKIIQVGGANPDTNQRYLYSSINKIVLKILSKCHSYMVDAFLNTKVPLKTVADFTNFINALQYIQTNYKIEEFCEDLLFGEDGLIPSLEFLASEFVQGDFRSDDDTNITPVTLNDILTNAIFSLQAICGLIFMLESSTVPITYEITSTLQSIIPGIIPKGFIDFYALCPQSNASFTVAILAIIYQFYYDGTTPFSDYIKENIGLKTDSYGYQVGDRVFLTGEGGQPCSLPILLSIIITKFASELPPLVSSLPLCGASGSSGLALGQGPPGGPYNPSRAVESGFFPLGPARAPLGASEYPALGLGPEGNFETGSQFTGTSGSDSKSMDLDDSSYAPSKTGSSSSSGTWGNQKSNEFKTPARSGSVDPNSQLTSSSYASSVGDGDSPIPIRSFPRITQLQGLYRDASNFDRRLAQGGPPLERRQQPDQQVGVTQDGTPVYQDFKGRQYTLGLYYGKPEKYYFGGGKKPKSTRRNKKTKLRKTYKKKAIKIKKNTYRKRLMKRTKKNKTRKYRHK